jgi:hypothetical protein
LNVSLTTEPGDIDRQNRRSGFFRYFCERLATATSRHIQLPDRMILLSGGLDALANHWYATCDRSSTPASSSSVERMRLFLLRHGGHPAFEKVSAPMFRNDRGEELSTFPFASYRSFEMNEVRNWADDPSFSALEATVPERKALLRWSYPGIVYVDFRCAWVHTFLQENEDIILTESDTLLRDEPYYRFVSNTKEFKLVMPVAFLEATFGRAIESYEREATARDILPFTDHF